MMKGYKKVTLTQNHVNYIEDLYLSTVSLNKLDLHKLLETQVQVKKLFGGYRTETVNPSKFQIEEYLFNNSKVGIEHEMFHVIDYGCFITTMTTWRYTALIKLYDLSRGYLEGEEIYLDDILYSLLTNINEQMGIRGLL